jgi:hypothetical protein
MAETPAIVIPVGLLRLVPVIVTRVPAAPELGEKLVMVGCEKTTELSNKNTEIKKIFFMKLIYARIIIEFNNWCKYLKL